MADYANDISAVTVDLSAGTAIDGWGNTDTLIDMDYVSGSQHDDTLIGNDFNNTL